MSSPAHSSGRGSASASSASARGWTSTCPSTPRSKRRSAKRFTLPKPSLRGWRGMADESDFEHGDDPVRTIAHPAPLGLRRRGIYLLPNLFTTGVLFCGFFAIVQAMNGRYDIGCIAIFVAMVLDGMDGRVARWTNTQSEFGAQYDSIADMVAFGAAPALVAYEWALKDLGTLGWIAAFLYCAGTAIRLARFNVNIGIVDKRYFQGLPSPSGAAVLAGLVWVMTDFGFKPSEWVGMVTWGVAVF